jgi:hypothetical protein
MAKFMDEGSNRTANILLGTQAVDGTLYLGIYKNSTEPALADGLSALTEPSGSGYARIPLTRGLWTIIGGLATYASQRFDNSGTNWGDIWGCFVCTTLTGTTGKLLAIDHLEEAIPVVDGAGITVLPKMLFS